MLNEPTLSTLNALKLFGMAHGFTERTSHPNSKELSHEEFFGLVQDEKTDRENLRLKRLFLRKILSSGLDRLEDNRDGSESPLPAHENIRGGHYDHCNAEPEKKRRSRWLYKQRSQSG